MIGNKEGKQQRRGHYLDRPLEAWFHERLHDSKITLSNRFRFLLEDNSREAYLEAFGRFESIQHCFALPQLDSPNCTWPLGDV